MLACGTDVAEPGTNSLRKGRNIPLLPDHPGRTPSVTDTEDGEGVVGGGAGGSLPQAGKARTQPSFSLTAPAVPSSNSRECGHAAKRHQRTEGQDFA